MICDTCADKNYCEPHRKNGELIVMCGAYKKLPTNADPIRAMSNEELADAFAAACPPTKGANRCCEYYGLGTDGCRACWLDWLQSAVDGGDGDGKD